jgi:hypothetical protein
MNIMSPTEPIHQRMRVQLPQTYAGCSKSYPTLNCFTNILVTKSDVLGFLARWAVQQSPFVVPYKLDSALEQFSANWRFGDYATFCDIHTLQLRIYKDMTAISEIVMWNSRKNGKTGMGLSSRFDTPSPDDDFVDLHALARNIAMDVWHEGVDFKLFNEALNLRD